MRTTTTSTPPLMMAINPAKSDIAQTHLTLASLVELLGWCEEFLRTASPLVHAELRAYLAHQAPLADPSWFLDMLGVSSVHLRHLLPTSTTPPSEAWQRSADHAKQQHNEQGVWA